MYAPALQMHIARPDENTVGSPQHLCVRLIGSVLVSEKHPRLSEERSSAVEDLSPLGGLTCYVSTKKLQQLDSTLRPTVDSPYQGLTNHSFFVALGCCQHAPSGTLN